MSYFFQRSTKLKPVDSIFNSDLSNETCKDVSREALKYNRLCDNAINTVNTYTDLEMFSGVEEENDSILKKIDYTKTYIGSNYLFNVLSNPTKDILELKSRQEIIKKLLSSKNKQKINDILDKLKSLEKSVIWMKKKKSKEEQIIIDSVFFQNKYLKKFNESEKVMNIYNYFRIIFSPIYGLLSPLLFLLMPFLYLRIFMGIKIPFFTYLKLFKYTIFGGMPDPFEMIKKTRNVMKSNDPRSAMHDILNPKKPKMKVSSVVSTLFSIVLYIQNVLNSFEISTRSHETINSIHAKLNECSDFITSANELIELTNDIINNNENECFPILLEKTFKNSPGILTNKGRILTTFNNVHLKSENFDELLNIVAEIDYFMSVVLLKESDNYCFSEYLESDVPKLELNEIWHPYINLDSRVENSISTDVEYPNIIITGPNAGGKSTFIKSVTLSIIFSQTLGISMGKEVKLTPFTLVNTYLNIPDVKGKESLFEAEMHRARDHLNLLDKLDKNEFSFLIMDEIFSSTNPEEGIAGGYAICEKLGSYKNSISFITTHFTKLTELKDSSNYCCYKIPIERDDNDNIKYTYKLQNGISTQFIALELLKNKGFNEDLVKRAMNICENKKINEEGLESNTITNEEEESNTNEENEEEELNTNEEEEESNTITNEENVND